MSTIDAATVLTFALTLVGRALKTTPKVKDEWIPILLPLIGGALSLAVHWLLGEPVSRAQFLLGAMAGAGSVGVNQAWRQMKPDASDIGKAAGLVAIGFFVLTSSGCMSRQTAAVVKAMGQSNASLSVQIRTIYGTVSVVRVNPDTNSMPHSLNSDGTVTVKP